MLKVSGYVGVWNWSSESYKLNFNLVPFLLLCLTNPECKCFNTSSVEVLDFNKSVFLLMPSTGCGFLVVKLAISSEALH